MPRVRSRSFVLVAGVGCRLLLVLADAPPALATPVSAASAASMTPTAVISLQALECLESGTVREDDWATGTARVTALDVTLGGGESFCVVVQSAKVALKALSKLRASLAPRGAAFECIHHFHGGVVVLLQAV
jgi:hypothetical protein